MSPSTQTTINGCRPLTEGFWEQAAGVTLWMAVVACCGLTYMQPILPEHLEPGWYALPQQLGYAVAYFACAALEWRRGPLPTAVYAYGVALSFSTALLAILICLFLAESAAMLSVGGACMGVGQTLGYMAWIRMTATRPMREIVYLTFLASFSSVMATAAFTFIPTAVRFAVLAGLLIPGSVALIIHYDRAHYRVSSNVLHAGRALHGMGRQVWTTLASPIIYCAALTLIAPVVSTAYVDTYGRETFRTLLAQGANLVALAGLAVVYFVRNRQPRMAEVYTALLPVLATLVLVSAFLDPAQRWFVLFAGDACYCVVSLLLLFTVCETSQNLGISAAITYGILGGFVYLARVPEALLALYPTSPFDGVAPLAITAVLLYLLVIPAFAVPALRHRQRDEAAPAPGPLGRTDPCGPGVTIRKACASLAQDTGLPPHQLKVLTRLVEGDSVKRIADELGLSESTVRTYRKGIYASLGVHSMQDLVDTVRKRAQQLGAGES